MDEVVQDQLHVAVAVALVENITLLLNKRIYPGRNFRMRRGGGGAQGGQAPRTRRNSQAGAADINVGAGPAMFPSRRGARRGRGGGGRGRRGRRGGTSKATGQPDSGSSAGAVGFTGQPWTLLGFALIFSCRTCQMYNDTQL